ncbi:uncharacterized protein M421DRAFT_112356 [Didymella exigua CBS 183.55]|uniref:Uncharacterized protein n=1 Tax=Didymella exigua CBS 183.55 TaxID=1150837 RepID=A0A6A5S6H2_9PLEO|nr:uncharacterized protein M421DRAFT_112356 [Didymella exigua CBS 183.55]KAF1934086.1 hypothetical protein M421DRAFT_112356 [Didymella exigua CBS 183.55]
MISTSSLACTSTHHSYTWPFSKLASTASSAPSSQAQPTHLKHTRGQRERSKVTVVFKQSEERVAWRLALSPCLYR